MVVNIIGKKQSFNDSNEILREDKFVSFFVDEPTHVAMEVVPATCPVAHTSYYSFTFSYKEDEHEFLVQLENIQQAVVCCSIIRDSLETAASTGEFGFIKLYDLEGNKDFINKQVQEWNKLEAEQKKKQQEEQEKLAANA